MGRRPSAPVLALKPAQALVPIAFNHLFHRRIPCACLAVSGADTKKSIQRIKDVRNHKNTGFHSFTPFDVHGYN
ncbi:MAG TPA: hypothetical protein DHV36_12025 [Desulfobacteraceae bacterium]|nr:hypothetical protein [Desulfobacteraceae bacterium]